MCWDKYERFEHPFVKYLFLSYQTFVRDTKIEKNILTCTVILHISEARFRIYYTVSAVRVSILNYFSLLSEQTK